MRIHFVVSRVLVTTALVACIDSEPITNPSRESTRTSGAPPLGPMSTHVASVGAMSTHSPIPTVATAAFDFATSGKATSFASAALGDTLTATSTRLLWQRTTTGERSIWMMDGTVWGGDYRLMQVPNEWSIVGSADFNGDGFGDIVWERSTTQEHSIWLMNGDIWSGYYALLPTAPADWSITGVGDLNADGNPDLLWQRTNGERSVWYMNGASVDHYGFLPQEPIEWRIVGTGDFNRDGQIDLVWENLTQPRDMRRSIWFMKGGTWTGQYVLLNAVDVPDGWSIVGVGDFNADAKPDLVWQRTTTGERSIWLMNGSSISSFANLQTVANTEWKIAAPLAPTGRPGHSETRASIPTNRLHPGSGVIDGIFYVAGGRLTGTSSSTAATEAYNPATNTWTTNAGLSNARESPASAVVNGMLYVFGGMATGTGPVLSTVEAYSPGTNTWTAKASMPGPRYAAVAGVVNGIIYVAGGYSTYGFPGTYQAAVYAYNPATNTWTTKAAMPTPLAYSAAAVVNGILYVAGGYGFSGVYATMEAYNPASDTWSFAAPMSVARGYAAGAAIDGIMYVVGGGNVTGQLAIIEAYSPTANTWKRKNPMPSARFGPVAGVINGVVYVAGNDNNFAGGTEVLAFYR